MSENGQRGAKIRSQSFVVSYEFFLNNTINIHWRPPLMAVALFHTRSQFFRQRKLFLITARKPQFKREIQNVLIYFSFPIHLNTLPSKFIDLKEPFKLSPVAKEQLFHCF